LDREDRVARRDELRPPFGAEQELALRLQPVDRFRVDREIRIEGSHGLLLAVRLEEGMRLRVQSARVFRVEVDDLRRLHDDLVPAGEVPQRLETARVGLERLRRQLDRAVVGVHGVDVASDAAQHLRPAIPSVRVRIALADRLIVGPQRVLVLLRGREDIAAEPPRVGVVRVNLDHAVEASEGPLRFVNREVRPGFPLERVLPIGLDPERAIERRLGLVRFVPAPVGVALPDPHLGVLRAQREDARVSVDVLRVEGDGLHVRADGLRPLLERDVCVPLVFPQDLRLRIDLERDVVVAEGIGRAAPGDEDLGLEPERVHAAAVRGQGLARGRLRRLEAAHAQEAFADTGEGLGELLEARGRFPHLEEAEGLDERDRRASLGACVQRRGAGVHEPVHFFEEARFPIEEALVEGHPYHPIPRDVAPWGRVGQVADMRNG
jgi:hypothetical protein